MLNIFALYNTDEKLETNGAWVPFLQGSRLLVAREGNPHYTAELNRLYEENQEKLRLEGEEADELNKLLLAKVYARTILKGWENISFDGKTLTEYNEENAVKALLMKDFMLVVQSMSRNIDHYRHKVEAEQAKN
jgi:hypothetical protein